MNKIVNNLILNGAKTNMRKRNKSKVMKYKESKHKPLRVMDCSPNTCAINKFDLSGPGNLTNVELLSIIIGIGRNNEYDLNLSTEIMNHVDNNLSTLAKMTKQEIMKFTGIGEKKASRIVAMMEISRRRMSEKCVSSTQISNSEDVYNYVKPIFLDLRHEELHAIVTDVRNKVIGIKKISQGGVSETASDIKLMLKYALDNAAPRMFVVHNHPSNDYHPSKSDDRMTTKLKNACNLMDIQLLDHVIFTNYGYYSYADEGKI